MKVVTALFLLALFSGKNALHAILHHATNYD